MTRAAALLALALVGCPRPAEPPPAAPPPPPQAPPPPTPDASAALVTAALTADVPVVTPGRPFTVSTRLQVAPGWHVYAEDPGETGLPTKVALALPPGYSKAPTRYPPPRRFVSPGPITSFGYEGEVTLTQQVTPPAQAPAGAVPLRARVSWLACSSSCVPGSAELTLELPIKKETP